jgi:hypothetical protein
MGLRGAFAVCLQNTFEVRRELRFFQKFLQRKASRRGENALVREDECKAIEKGDAKNSLRVAHFYIRRKDLTNGRRSILPLLQDEIKVDIASHADGLTVHQRGLKFPAARGFCCRLQQERWAARTLYRCDRAGFVYHQINFNNA